MSDEVDWPEWRHHFEDCPTCTMERLCPRGVELAVAEVELVIRRRRMTE